MNLDEGMAALVALTGALGRKAFDTKALPNATPPYYVLSSAGIGRAQEPETANGRPEVGRLRVTSVGATPAVARLAGSQLRATLCPGNTWAEAAPGFFVRWVGRDVDSVESSTTPTGALVSTAYVVDTYAMHTI